MLKYAFTMMSDPNIRTAADLRGKRAHTSFLKDPNIDLLYEPANREEAIELLARSTQLDRTCAAGTYDYYVGELRPYSRNLAIPNSALQGTLDTMVATGDIQSPTPPLSRYFDPSYLPR